MQTWKRFCVNELDHVFMDLTVTFLDREDIWLCFRQLRSPYPISGFPLRLRSSYFRSLSVSSRCHVRSELCFLLMIVFSGSH